jgi:hypothetical protein
VLTTKTADCKGGMRWGYIILDGEIIEEGCWEPWEDGKTGYVIEWQ